MHRPAPRFLKSLPPGSVLVGVRPPGWLGLLPSSIRHTGSLSVQPPGLSSQRPGLKYLGGVVFARKMLITGRIKARPVARQPAPAGLQLRGQPACRGPPDRRPFYNAIRLRADAGGSAWEPMWPARRQTSWSKPISTPRCCKAGGGTTVCVSGRLDSGRPRPGVDEGPVVCSIRASGGCWPIAGRPAGLRPQSQFNRPAWPLARRVKQPSTVHATWPHCRKARRPGSGNYAANALTWARSDIHQLSCGATSGLARPFVGPSEAISNSRGAYTRPPWPKQVGRVKRWQMLEDAGHTATFR